MDLDALVRLGLAFRDRVLQDNGASLKPSYVEAERDRDRLFPPGAPLRRGGVFARAAGPGGARNCKGLLRKKRGACGFWYVCRGVIFVLSVEGSGHHRRAFDTSTVKIPGRLRARSIAG